MNDSQALNYLMFLLAIGTIAMGLNDFTGPKATPGSQANAIVWIVINLGLAYYWARKFMKRQ
jgi:hypothetical protein